MLIGNNIALVVYGFYGVFTDESDRFVRVSLSDLLNSHSDSLVYLIVLMTAEFLPKVFKLPMV
jgi:hypothetical protein